MLHSVQHCPLGWRLPAVLMQLSVRLMGAAWQLRRIRQPPRWFTLAPPLPLPQLQQLALGR